MAQRPADVTISLYWDSRWKRWGIVGRAGSYTATMTADTTAEVDQAAVWMIVKTIKAELESFLELDLQA